MRDGKHVCDVVIRHVEPPKSKYKMVHGLRVEVGRENGTIELSGPVILATVVGKGGDIEIVEDGNPTNMRIQPTQAKSDPAAGTILTAYVLPEEKEEGE